MRAEKHIAPPPAHTQQAPQNTGQALWLPNPVTGDLEPSVNGERVAWAPMPGSQVAYLSCPVFETLFEGTRGPGKTIAALMDFAQHVGTGHGRYWSGLVFRRTYPELEDIVNQAKQWFPRIWPDSHFHETKHQWEWETGEHLMFRHADRDADYWKHHGANRPFILWEELTTWPNLNLYHMMMSICRSPIKNLPRKYRATSNPYGPGHNHVKKRWQLGLTDAEKKLPVKPKRKMIGPLIKETINGQTNERVSIHGHISENKILLHSDPGYVARLTQAAPNPAALLAWLEGDWDVVAGGLLDDVWVPSVHVIPDIPGEAIPRSWRIARAYDHGQSRPFSVQWWACSDGTPARFTAPVLTADGIVYQEQVVGQVAGDEILLNEWYGARKDEKGQTMPNAGLNLDAGTEIAPGIRDREERYFSRYGLHVHPGPADSAIFDDSSPGKSVAADMRRPPGRITWTRADKRAGSRIQGVQQVRRLLKGALNIRSTGVVGVPDIMLTGQRTTPGMFICQTNLEWLRTVPTLPRDPKTPDDADTNAEDHCVTGDTIVQTSTGPRSIASMVGTTGQVYAHDSRLHNYTDCELRLRDAEIVEISFTDGTTLRCTPDHKILIHTGQWTRADSLSPNDLCWSVPQFKSSAASGTTCAGNISAVKDNSFTAACIAPILERSPKARTSTTKTTTAPTTNQKIWKRWDLPNISGITGSIIRNIFRRKLTQRLRSGTAAKKAVHGTANTIDRMLQNSTKSVILFVNSAERRFIPRSRHRASVRTSASPPHEGTAASTTSSGHVRSAPRSSQSVSISPQRHAADSVAEVSHVRTAGRADVYCMNVEEVHNFAVQGGVIVQNCFDTTRYYTRRAGTVIRQERF